jgi:glyoxylase-like metal-dependent hydrolase (beta-lactamase superfamily II)
VKVHHLNCGTMKLPSPMVCHVLLIETDDGLVLVDSGYGTRDCDDPRRIGPSRRMIRPVLSRTETVAYQLDILGYARDDVRHIIVTHMDVDHVGGLADFPDAQVHLTAAEALGAIWAPSRREKLRYRSVQWAHKPNIVEHDPRGEKWRGFAAAKELTAISPGIALVSLPGHTRGHTCVVVDTGHRWVLHAGDAFYHHGTLDGTPVPRGLATMESMLAFDRKRVLDNHSRLVELYQRQEPDLLIVCAHDPTLLEKARATA